MIVTINRILLLTYLLALAINALYTILCGSYSAPAKVEATELIRWGCWSSVLSVLTVNL